MTHCFLSPQFNSCKLFEWLLTCIKKKNVSLANLHICTKFNCSATKSTRQSESELRWDNMATACLQPPARDRHSCLFARAEISAWSTIWQHIVCQKSTALLRRAGGRDSEITYSHERHVWLFLVCSWLFFGKISKKRQKLPQWPVFKKQPVGIFKKQFFSHQAELRLVFVGIIKMMHLWPNEFVREESQVAKVSAEKQITSFDYFSTNKTPDQ